MKRGMFKIASGNPASTATKQHTASLLALVMLLIASLLLLWATRVPGIEEGPVLLIAIILLLFAIACWLYDFFQTSERGRLHKALQILWPVLLIFTFIFAWYGLPEKLAFSASKSELATAAEQAIRSSSAQTGSTQRWIGVYYITKTERIESGAILHLNGASSMSFRFSLGYFPDKSPKDIRGDWLEYEHYAGPWYVMKYYAL
jgi:NADH:ubiquinone oxidoreductase subunit 6 (subunit J)